MSDTNPLEVSLEEILSEIRQLRKDFERMEKAKSKTIDVETKLLPVPW